MGLCRFHVSLGEGRVQPEGICVTKNLQSLMLVAGFQGFRFLDFLLQGVWDCVFTGLGLQGSIQMRDSCLGGWGGSDEVCLRTCGRQLPAKALRALLLL